MKDSKYMSLIIDFWGVRGSLPFAPAPIENISHYRTLMKQFFDEGNANIKDLKAFTEKMGSKRLGGFGMATTCVQVSSPNESIIIDAGTGIKHLGDQLMQGPAAHGKATINLFLTHFHWDHLIGLPLFEPAFVRGNKIKIFGVQPETERLLKDFIRRPWTEHGIATWAGDASFHLLEARQPYVLGDMTIIPYMMDHPDPCWGLKITCGNKTYAHCADTEAHRVTPKSLGADLPMYQNVDLMYFDAQYPLGELADRLNWGHSAAQIGLELAFKQNIKRVLFSHHDPSANIDSIEKLIKQTQEYHRWKVEQAHQHKLKLPKVDWEFVGEGQRVVL